MNGIATPIVAAEAAPGRDYLRPRRSISVVMVVYMTGEALEQKITELVETGRLKYFEDLKATIAPGLVAMLEIPGLGPKKIQAVQKHLGVDSVEKLEAACKAGKVAELAGFGEKTQTNILEGIVVKHT